MIAQKRLEQFLNRRGMKIHKYQMLRDSVGVEYRKLLLFNIPSKTYPFPNENNRVSGLSMRTPSYHEIIPKARFYWYKFKLTSWFKELRQEACNQKFNPHEYEVE